MPPPLLPQPWCSHTWWGGAALLHHRKPNTAKVPTKVQFSGQKCDRESHTSVFLRLQAGKLYIWFCVCDVFRPDQVEAKRIQLLRKRRNKNKIFLHKTVCKNKRWLLGQLGRGQKVLESLDHKNKHLTSWLKQPWLQLNDIPETVTQQSPFIFISGTFKWRCQIWANEILVCACTHGCVFLLIEHQNQHSTHKLRTFLRCEYEKQKNIFDLALLYCPVFHWKHLKQHLFLVDLRTQLRVDVNDRWGLRNLQGSRVWIDTGFYVTLTCATQQN